MSTKISSYRYDNLEEQEQAEEFERLFRQASSLIRIERQLWPESGILPGARILDVGCGSGIVTQELATYAYPGHVVGVDISQSLIEKGQQAYTRKNESRSASSTDNITLMQGNVYDLPFPENSFDVVHSRFIFQHLSNPIEALENIWRVLKPDGLICIIDVDKSWSGLSPEPATSVALDKAIIEKQLAQGGDPWVGRKLSYYLSAVGFSKPKTNITLVDSDQLGFSNYVEMLAFGASPKNKKNELTALREKAQPDILNLMDSQYAWAGFALFVATGRKGVIKSSS
ncbi:MAG: class I SAM-dependent methyltransferase [Cyanobacteria bacterium J06650_10]